MRYRAVLFDLDGTLLDSLHDIADAANAVLERRGFSTHPHEDYRRFIGDGVDTLFRRALPPERAEPELLRRCVTDFGNTYAQVWNVKTRPYEGIPPLLDALESLGVTLAVLSNKPDEFTRRCVAHYLSVWPIRAAFGERPGVPRKPDPAGALEIAGLVDIPTSAFLYVGDTAVDMETARRAGMTPIGAAWGFRSAEELRSAGAGAIIESPLELLRFLDRSTSE